MWWLVTMSPSAETKPPEPPLLKRTEAFWACSSQASVRSKLYFSLRSCRGGLFSSHMPSSARTATPWTQDARITATTPKTSRMRFMTTSSPTQGYYHGEPIPAGHETTERDDRQGERTEGGRQLQGLWAGTGLIK